MGEVTIIIGLPGSGKTFLGNELSKKENVPFFDDIGIHIKAWKSAANWLFNLQNCIIADPLLCYPDKLTSLIKEIIKLNPYVKFNYVWFANEPEVCIENIKDRDERIISDDYIYRLSEIYLPLKETVPCYRKD